MNVAGTQVRVIRTKTFVESTASELDAAVLAWARDQRESRVVGQELTHDGANIVLTIFYAG